MPDFSDQPQKRRKIDRVIAACDLCKRRKVKCDGAQPCTYCQRKDLADSCTFTAAQARGHSPVTSGDRTARGSAADASRQHSPTRLARTRALSERDVTREIEFDTAATSTSPTASRDDHHEDTAVPLEGRILRDAQGKVIFIGDCAPLSFLQTVRYLITSEVDSEGFAIQASRDSLIEIARINVSNRGRSLSVPLNRIGILVEAYKIATAGLVDLFDPVELLEEIKIWANASEPVSDDASAAIFFLVLAVGAQEIDESKSEAWFDHARELLLKHMCNSMNVATVQGFTLISIFMLRAFQPNGAYLYFSLAARTAYAIGIHRTEVNASFGESLKTKRDRIWKSLRVVDMLISNVLGRPPSTSDVDCTVKYRVSEESSDPSLRLLDASVQIFMIIERIVVEVYSRKRISIRIAEYVSRQLKGWASTWLREFTELTAPDSIVQEQRHVIVGACSALCSYYYGIMLLTRPFLIYEIYEHLGASLRGGGNQNDHREKRKYADAALDAAASFVETLQAVLQSNTMPHRMPLVVPWLFTTALVLAVGILGRSGLAFEESCSASIRCLDYFGKTDPHARQYSVIIRSLLRITIEHVRKRETESRLKRKYASSELFGLLPVPDTPAKTTPTMNTSPLPDSSTLDRTLNPPVGAPGSNHVPLDWTIYDADFFAMPWSNENDQGLQDFLQPGTLNLDGATVADVPLFPIYNQRPNSGFS